MKILVVEDDLASRKYLFKYFSNFGDCDITVDGMEAIDAFLLAHDEEAAYDLICLDIMMPKLDGMKALKIIRDMEKDKKIPEEKRAKIIMVTALNDTENVFEAFQSGCEAYAAKPIDTRKLEEVMAKLGLLGK